MCPISFSNLGELVIAQMFQEQPQNLLPILELEENDIDYAYIAEIDQFAFAETTIAHDQVYGFDPMHKVDVALWIRPNAALALELKLGETGLSRGNINNWLEPCVLNKNGTHLKGKMLAILDRRSNEETPIGDLVTVLNGQNIPLQHNWAIVARTGIIDNWQNDAPDFSPETQQIKVEDLIEAYGGEIVFNELVETLLEFNYFQAWNLGA
ncbi:MAG: hypothetical protein NZ807_10260 [Dehalococcoidia bacterium]|nr:hypothetical protein [Dehalococcoidia bacterium]